MNNSEKQKIIGRLCKTKKGVARLAASMTIPRRCGGMDYSSDGEPRYRYGGKLYTPEEADRMFEEKQRQQIEEVEKMPDYESEHVELFFSRFFDQLETA